MDKLELLYDHYKESYSLIKNAQTLRNHLFVMLCIGITVLFLFLLEPASVVQIMDSWAKGNLSIGIPFRLVIIQSFTWIIVLFLFIRYFQTNIYIDRQYMYIETLETTISKELTSVFDRESKNYLEQYPLVLNTIHIIYTWIFPLLSVLVVVYKIVLEWMQGIELIPRIIDTIFATMIVSITVMYLFFLHPCSGRDTGKVK